MTTDEAPWAHVALTLAGRFVGVIAHDGGDKTTWAKAAWQKEVRDFCGEHISSGGVIKTVTSREEYLAVYEAAIRARSQVREIIET